MKLDSSKLAEIVSDPDELLKCLVEETRMLSQPIDFADLEERGIISNEGAWYRVRNLWDLPEHAAKKINKIVHDPKGFRVTFYPASRYEKLQKRFEKMAAKEGLLK